MKITTKTVFFVDMNRNTMRRLEGGMCCTSETHNLYVPLSPFLFCKIWQSSLKIWQVSFRHHHRHHFNELNLGVGFGALTWYKTIQRFVLFSSGGMIWKIGYVAYRCCSMLNLNAFPNILKTLFSKLILKCKTSL